MNLNILYACRLLQKYHGTYPIECQRKNPNLYEWLHLKALKIY